MIKITLGETYMKEKDVMMYYMPHDEEDVKFLSGKSEDMLEKISSM